MLGFSCRAGDEFLRVVAVGLGMVMAGTVISGTPARAGSVSFTDFNLVTIGAKGDPTQGNVGTQSDVTGSAFVSGSLLATLTVAQDLPTVPTPSTNPVYGLEVLNNIESGINVNNGYSVEYAGTTAGNINLNGGGVLTKDASGILAAAQTTLYNQVAAASVDFKNLVHGGIERQQRAGQHSARADLQLHGPGQWGGRLQYHVEGFADLEPATVPQPRAGEFGGDQCFGHR